MNYYVGPKLERPLKVRAHKSVVDNESDSAWIRNGCYCPNVSQGHNGIGWGLNKDNPGVGPEGLIDALRIPRVHIGEFQAKILQHLVKEPESAAISIIADYYVVAGSQQRHCCIDCSHSGCKGVSGRAAFERSQISLKRHPRWILGA